MYTDKNFRTKKELKIAVLRSTGRHIETCSCATKNALECSCGAFLPRNQRPLTVFQPGPFAGKTDGRVCLEGPHYPEPHKWYATVEIQNGTIVKFIS